MADAASNLFEIERRSILFKSSTTLPDSSTLNYNGDPNLVVSGNSAGQFLLYYSPIGTSYIQDNGTIWDKKQLPNVWFVRGAGSGSGTSTESLSAYATISYVNEISSNLQSQIQQIINDYATLSYVDAISSNFGDRIAFLESQPAQDLSLRSDVQSISSNLQLQIYDLASEVLAMSSNLYNQNINFNAIHQVIVSNSINTLDTFENTLTSGCEWLVTVENGENLRISKILAVWDTISNISFYETSTEDIGDTTPIAFTVENVNGEISLIANITSGTWTVRYNKIKSVAYSSDITAVSGSILSIINGISASLYNQIQNVTVDLSDYITSSQLESISSNLYNQIQSISGGSGDYADKNLSNIENTLIPTDLIPSISDTYSLGTSSNCWKELFLSENSLYLGDKKLSVNEDGQLAWNGSLIDKWVVDNGTLMPIDGSLISGLKFSSDVEVFEKNNQNDFTLSANIENINGIFGNKPNPNALMEITDTVTSADIAVVFGDSSILLDGIISGGDYIEGVYLQGGWNPILNHITTDFKHDILLKKVEIYEDGDGGDLVLVLQSVSYSDDGENFFPLSSGDNFSYYFAPNDGRDAGWKFFTVNNYTSTHRYWRFSLYRPSGGNSKIREIKFYGIGLYSINNFISTALYNGIAKNIAPATIKVYDQNNNQIVDFGKIKIDYNKNNTGYTNNNIDLTSFKNLDINLFNNITSLDIQLQPIGTQTVIPRISIENTSSGIEFTQSGAIKILTNGIETDVLGNKVNIEEFNNYATTVSSITGNFQERITSSESYISGLISISGDLQSQIYGLVDIYATNVMIASISGDLQSQIISNDNDITRLIAISGEHNIRLDNIENGTVLDSRYINSTGDTMYGNFNVEGNVSINGNIIQISGSNLTQVLETSFLENNIIVLNHGEQSDGVLSGVAGFEIDRGTEPNYNLLFRENDDSIVIGISGNLQPVATREDVPISGGFAFWSATENKFETSSNYTIDKFLTKYTETIGDGFANPITITHNLGTRNIVYTILDNTTYQIIDANVVLATENSMVITFATPPTTNRYDITVIG
jgi:hypothetical protein